MPSIDATNWSAFSPLPATDSRKIALSAAESSPAPTQRDTAQATAKPQQQPAEEGTPTPAPSAQCAAAD